MRQTTGRADAPETAAAQVLAFLISGVVFVGAIGSLLLVSNGAGGSSAGDEPTEAAGRTLQASSLADLLVGSPGIGWALGADSVSRLGIEAANGTGLDLDNIQALRGAAYEADPDNGRIDYEEALLSLEMEDGTRFHLRMYPVGLESVYEASLGGIRTAYIGDWSSLPGITVSLASTSQMVAEANTQFNATMGSDTAEERQILLDMGLDFHDTVHIGDSKPDVTIDIPLLPDIALQTSVSSSDRQGDVFPDDKNYLNAVFSTRINEYDVLVVGSNVDHSSLTSDSTKSAIKAWVEAGGTLMVMGSSSQSTQWLQPLFQVGVKTVNGGAFAPDVAHPMLHEPHSLNWDTYDNHGQGWDIKSSGSGAHYDDFTHVVVEGGEDVLTVSNDGAFGSGRIFLTAYRAGEIAGDQSLQEAMNFLSNLMLYSERDHLYLEYGPQVPDGLPVAVAIRQSNVWDSELGNVAVRIEVHLWQDAPLSITTST